MKRNSLNVLIALALMSPAAALGDEHFDKRKSEAVSEIDEKIQKLQEHKNCVSGASTPDAMKGCRADMKEWRQGERLERLEKRKTRMDERIQKLKDKSEKPAASH